MALALTVGIGIIAFILVYIAFNIDKKEHLILKLLFIFSAIGLLLFIPSNAIDESQNCQTLLTGNLEKLITNQFITDALCIVNYDDSTSGNMTENELSRHYNNTKSAGFISQGLHTWNVTCSADSFSPVSANNNISIGDFSAFTFSVLNQTHFDLGTYYQTFFNTTSNSVRINSSFAFGQYASRIFDATGVLAAWVTLSYTDNTTASSTGLPLPDNQTTSEGINMTGNEALYHLDEPSGQINDTSLNANHGTNNGANYSIAGQIGTALRFDGINDYVALGGATTFEDNNIGTMAAWVYANSSVNSSNHAILGYGETINQDGFIFLLRGNGSRLALRLFEGPNPYDRLDTPYIIPINTWVHVAATSDGSTTRLYINGSIQNVTINSGSNTGAWIGDTTATVGVETNIGASFSQGARANFFNGTIDELVVLNRTLSDSEIFDFYNRGVGNATTRVRVRSCDDAACSGESYGSYSSLNPVTLSVNNNRYFQFDFNLTNRELFNATIEGTNGSAVVQRNSTRVVGSDSILTIWDASDLEGGSNNYDANASIVFFANYTRVNSNNLTATENVYELVCLAGNQTTSSSFFVSTSWVFRFAMIYFIIYLSYVIFMTLIEYSKGLFK